MSKNAGQRGFSRVILAILLIPLVPAILVHWVTRSSPPGQQVTPRAQEIHDAIQALPAHRGEASPLRYRLAVGDAWLISTTLEWVAEAEDQSVPLDDENPRELLRSRSGSLRFQVTSESADGGWWVAVSRDDEPRSKVESIGWSPDGQLRDEQGLDPRARWFAASGIVVAGPFRYAPRENELIVIVPADLGPRGQGVEGRLALTLGDDLFPPLGGLFLRGRSSGSGAATRLEVLGYRRRAAAGPHWAGSVESIWRGHLEAEDGRLELLSGEIRLRERFELTQGESTTALADGVTVIRQTCR
ncbi:MAG: hypothetical protein KDB53_17270 [Planctomycetes bacterium]|nr:hypothetical protein [Planctomycetota bacterium]